MMSHPTERNETAEQSRQYRDQEYWDKRALSFTTHAGRTHYAKGFLELMDLNPEWSVLDMACGGAALAIPLADKVKKVTAVDFSKNMLSVVSRLCKENNIANIDIIHGRREDDWKDLGIGEHDIAIASRCIHKENAIHCIQKLDHAAKRQVYISAPVGHGPFDMRAL
jgi:2-polyprenyl-3-methyl-5-hydroxy-6-metoxy-1,4-benzoquinol methylase